MTNKTHPMREDGGEITAPRSQQLATQKHNEVNGVLDVFREADSLWNGEDNEERPVYPEFHGGDVNEEGNYTEPTPLQREAFEKSIARLSEVLQDADFPWYLDGATTISLLRGKQMRHHKDIDIGVFREDLEKLTKLLSGEGYHIFFNYERQGKKFLREITLEELLTIKMPNLSICKIDSNGKIQKDIHDPFNFVDLHVHDKDSAGNTIVSYNGTTLPKEFFVPRVMGLANGKIIYLSQPAIVAYHKLHSNRPYDLTDLQKLKPYLQANDFAMLHTALGQEAEETERKTKAVLEEIWESLSKILEKTNEAKVISTQIWTHADLAKRKNDPKVASYIQSIAHYLSEHYPILFDDFLQQSLSIIKPREQSKQRMIVLDQLAGH